jgi:fatty acid desaturase
MDIWHQIKKREAEMNAQDKEDALQDKISEERRAREAKEMRDIGIAVVICAIAIGGIGWLLVKVLF